MILTKLKTAAEDFLGEKVTKAVITVSRRNFNDSQTASHQAGRRDRGPGSGPHHPMNRRRRR